MSRTLDKALGETAAMPTVEGDAIVDSGSNANGSWLRFSSGFQVTVSQTPLLSGNGTQSMTFPVTFIESPITTVTWQIQANYGSTTRVATQSAGTTSVVIIYRLEVNDTGWGNLIAMGRWK